jgi:hypothetical protein
MSNTEKAQKAKEALYFIEQMNQRKSEIDATCQTIEKFKHHKNIRIMLFIYVDTAQIAAQPMTPSISWDALYALKNDIEAAIIEQQEIIDNLFL